MGKIILLLLFSFFGIIQITFAQSVNCKKSSREVTCVGTVNGTSRVQNCPSHFSLKTCAKKFNQTYPSKQSDSGGSTTAGTSAAGPLINQTGQIADTVKNEQGAVQKDTAGEGATTGIGNATVATSEQGSKFGGYFKNSEAGIKACEDSWSSLFGQTCNIENNDALKAGQTAFADGGGLSANDVNSHMQASQDQIEIAKRANNSMNLAKSQCSGSLFSCGGICKSAKNAAENEYLTCVADAPNYAIQLCGTNNPDQTCISDKEKAFVKKCSELRDGYKKRASSAVNKCKLAGAAFLAIIVGGVIAIKKHKDKSKKLESEVSSDSVADSDSSDSGSTANQEIVWNNGRHEIASKNSNMNSTASGSTVSLGGSGSSSSVQTNSRKIADPNPNSDLNFKGYDPNQEYSVSSSSAGTNKLGSNNNAATTTGQKIMGAQQAASATATAGSGSLGAGVGSGGTGASGGSNSANSELAAYMPGGARDPAAAVNAEQVREYNEARKQIRFAHSPSNFKAVQSAYEREKNRMGINSLGVGN